MTPLESKIVSAATKNRTLLTTLSQTDHAPADLAQQRRLITDLEFEASESDKRLDYIAIKRSKEFADHENYRDSVVRRFAFKATGRGKKFAQRAAKEEQEYFEVLQSEQQQQEVNRTLKEQLRLAREQAAELEGKVAEHERAQRELNSLYEEIFGGPTEGLPEEDAAEERLKRAMGAYQEARAKAEAENMACQLLEGARKKMQYAIGCMGEALQASRMDMWSNNSFADMIERNALHRAESEVVMANMDVVQAQRFSPQVGTLPPVEINHGQLMRDVFFDNIFTDMKFHEEIKNSAARVEFAANHLDGIIGAAQGRFNILDQEFKRKEKDLTEARSALQNIREAAFERMSEPPPAY